ncbi:NUDIX hydrolase (plasmid) [Leptospira interrogans serovar Bataviae]|nr:NUDIX hydrolase [Leptospira interrogans serovar Bataviae]
MVVPTSKPDSPRFSYDELTLSKKTSFSKSRFLRSKDDNLNRMDFFFKKKGLRVRVAALIENSQNEVLLIQQKKKDSYYWLLPGGGIEFGESAEDALKRELKEELSLEMKSASFLLLNESIEPGGKRHLIQLVFSVNVRKEVPELNLNEKAITGFGYFSSAAIREMDLRPDIKSFLLEGDFKSAPFIKSIWVSEKK